jgi:ABC-type antimicrobial peptide transport system permease subunit
VAGWPIGRRNFVDLGSWTVGLSLIVLTIAIHSTGVVMMAFGLEKRIRVRVAEHLDDPRRAIPIAIGHIGAVALILAALHGLESLLWGLAYRWLGALGSFTDASVYSLAAMTTLDVPALVVPARWRMITALEAVRSQHRLGSGPSRHRRPRSSGPSWWHPTTTLSN